MVKHPRSGNGTTAARQQVSLTKNSFGVTAFDSTNNGFHLAVSRENALREVASQVEDQTRLALRRRLANDKKTLFSMDENLEMVREGREPSGPRGPSQLTERYLAGRAPKFYGGATGRTLISMGAGRYFRHCKRPGISSVHT